MTFTPTDREALLATVRDHVNRYGIVDTALTIREANNGHPDGNLVTNANLHLFRQYRNTVSSAPLDLINEATREQSRRNPRPSDT